MTVAAATKFTPRDACNAATPDVSDHFATPQSPLRSAFAATRAAAL